MGALVGQAGLKRRTGLGMAALIVGANLPDIDTVYALGGTTNALAVHRGITHGPLGMLLLPALLAGLLSAWDRSQERRGKRPPGRLPVRFGWLYLLGLIGCLTHVGLDWLSSHGVRLLEPFSSRWFYGDLIYIVDIWMLLGFGLALWLSRRRELRGGAWWWPPRVALAATLGYIGVNGVITHVHATRASAGASRDQILIADELPVAFWRREMISGRGDGLWTVGNRHYGDLLLAQCDLARARRIDPRIGAYLFWARAPFIWRDKGGWMLGDARYADELAQVVVALPDGVCPPPGSPAAR